MNCTEWFMKYLTARGPVRCQEARSAAKRAGYTKSELKSTRQSLGIITTRSLWDRNTFFWELPKGE